MPVLNLQDIRWCLSRMTPDNCIVIVQSQSFAKDTTCNLVEHWFQTRYGSEGAVLIHLEFLWFLACLTDFQLS